MVGGSCTHNKHTAICDSGTLSSCPSGIHHVSMATMDRESWSERKNWGRGEQCVLVSLPFLLHVPDSHSEAPIKLVRNWTLCMCMNMCMDWNTWSWKTSCSFTILGCPSQSFRAVISFWVLASILQNQTVNIYVSLPADFDASALSLTVYSAYRLPLSE